MGKSAPSAPAPPDPAKTAAAQGAANVETAIAQGLMNMYNQSGPFGSTVYNRIGTETVGSGENARDIPRYEQITTLTPSQQRQLNLTNQLGESALGVGNSLFGNVANQVQQPFNFDNIPKAPGVNDFSAERNRVEDALYNRATSRLDDRFGRDQSALEQKLANQGLQQGSEAYTNAMKDFSFGKNDAYDQAMNSAIANAGGEQSRLFGLGQQARQQGIQEASFLRSQPINELSALLGFSNGVQGPQFSAPPQTGIQNTDVMGAYNTAYQGALNNYNTQMQSRNAAMGGIAGIGGSIAGALPWATMFSDSRIKEDITKVGTLNNGLPVYTFRYIGDDKFNMGLMAQDVEKVKPEAVMEIGGIKAVNYAEAVR